jgi:protein CpxP
MKKLFLICCLFIGLTSAGYAQTHPATSDPAEKAKGLQKQLKLTDAQTAKVATIYTESADKFKKIKVAEKGNTNKMLVDIAPLRTETIKKIKGVLTPEQKVKYDKLVKDTKNTGGNGWSDGWTPASSN